MFLTNNKTFLTNQETFLINKKTLKASLGQQRGYADSITNYRTLPRLQKNDDDRQTVKQSFYKHTQGLC